MDIFENAWCGRKTATDINCNILQVRNRDGLSLKNLVRKRDGYWLSKIATTDTDIRTRPRNSGYA